MIVYSSVLYSWQLRLNASVNVCNIYQQFSKLFTIIRKELFIKKLYCMAFKLPIWPLPIWPLNSCALVGWEVFQ